ncbi:amidohydrolase/deacetylase family metallohydrolase [Microvirga massiliensis]|uniref:amidohydrolase/deacetylase family metallohydrolase n=1 Tax=Microvirga massiliensis TaxID=1033741 RepID=UPI00062B3C11|nr:amidohydrolase/deacetylase family metallohydrolase [Microvirga massiliensis]
MSGISRRACLQLGTSGIAAAALAAMAGPAGAALGPNDKYDLLIKGGEVLDPSGPLRARRDIGIRRGLIEAVEADIPAERTLQTLDAAGRLVVPGLIDLHTHVYPYGSALGIPADETVPFTGVTTVVSAGDAGANNLAALRRHIAAQTRTRMFAFVHIANIGLAGFPVAELYNIDYAQVDACAKAIAENPDFVLGAKVRMSENVVAQHGAEPLRRAIQACELSGRPARVMVHIGGVETAALMSEILDLLRPGDILTHCYSGAPNLAGQFTNIVQDGKLLPAALAAKQRGVVFDVGHGGGSFDYTVAEAAIQQGCPPDTISSDLHVVSGNTPGMPFLPWVMSKFLGLGFTLDQVIAMATTAPAKAIDRGETLGTLQTGAPGDVTLLEVIEGPVSFVDTRNNRREGHTILRPVQTVNNGVPFGRPFQLPFAVK